jgi:hypothetical protein
LSVSAAFVGTSAKCLPVTLDPSSVYFAVGSEIPPAMFAPATSLTE